MTGRMNISVPILLYLLLNGMLTITTLAQPYWFKGNTHTHTSYSDGKLTPREAVNEYKAEGYHFLFITDHGVVTPIGNSLSDSTFLCIEGEESESFHHLSCLDIHQTIYTIDPLEIIDSTRAQGGFIIVNHPMRGNHEVYVNDIIDIEDLKLIEIFNGKSEKDNYHDDQSLWDSLLHAGRLYYGVAADDMHEKKHLGKGWIMVLADTLQKDSIINAIKEGNFYASTGVTFTKLIVEDSIIQIATDNATKIDFIGDMHVTLKTINSDTASYKIIGDEGYVRAVATNADGKKAWTQPLFWNKTYEGNPYVNSSHEIIGNTSFHVYPNPSTGLLYIHPNTIETGLKYTFYDLSGCIIAVGDIGHSSVSIINLINFKRGMYFLHLENKTTFFMAKIVLL